MISLLIATRNAHKVGEIRAILGNEFRYLTLADFPDALEVVEDAGTFAGNATKKAVELAAWLAAVQSPKSKVRGPKSGGRSPGAEVQSPAAEVQSPKSKAQSLKASEAPWITHHVSRFTFHATSPTFVLADDSGLEVDALGGAPGVHSARFAALDTGKPGNSEPAENNAKLLRLLQDVAEGKRTARFRCVVALTPVLEASAENASAVCYANELELQTELFEGICEGRIGFELRGRAGFGYDPLFFPAGYDETFGELSEDVKNRLSHRAQALGKLRRWLAVACSR